MKDNVWLKIAIAMLPVLGISITLWADVRTMKSENIKITDGRIVAIEYAEHQHDRDIDELRKKIDRIYQRGYESNNDSRNRTRERP